MLEAWAKYKILGIKFYIPQNEVESYELRTRQEKVFPFCSLCHKLKVEEGIFYL